MEHRHWEKANLTTSLLGYGCMRFPTLPDGGIDEARAEALLNTAREAGVNYFDTAYPYHGGKSEPFVGRVIAKWPRESFIWPPSCRCGSATRWKRPRRSTASSSSGWASSTSTSICSTPPYGPVRPSQGAGHRGLAVGGEKAGRIRNFGFSCHDNAAGLEHILRDQPWDFCQLQYNYLDTDDRAEEIAGDRGYALTEELGIPLIIMEPIKGGTLANLPADAAAPLTALDPDASAASWALRWVGSHKNVHLILSGMSAEEQLADNLATFAQFRPLNDAEMDAVARQPASCTAGSRSAARAAGTVCPAPWGWTSRTTSASGTSWGCSASRMP